MKGRRARRRGATRHWPAQLALMGLLLLASGLVLAERTRAARQRRAAAADTARARNESERIHAAQERNALLVRGLAQAQGPSAPVGALLAALARATPPAVTLCEVTCQPDGFILRGHLDPTAGGANDALLRFRQGLCPPDAAWQIAEPGAAAADFTWHGLFLPRPAPAGESPLLAAQLAAARAALPTADGFDAWRRRWSQAWTVLAQSSEHGAGLEVRHYALAYARPRLGAWSDIVRTLQALGTQPGLSVDRLVLATAPGEADSFTQAQLTFTARLRP